MDAPDELEPPERCEQECEACSQLVHFLRVTTPAGMPDVICPLDPTAWFGWAHSDSDDVLTLVVICTRQCLGRWTANECAPGA